MDRCAGRGTSESEVEEARRAGEEREVCIHVVGNRGIYSSSHTRRVGRDGGVREDAE